MKKIMTLIAAAAVMSACCCNNNGKKAGNCENACPETKTECCETESEQCCDAVDLEGKWTIATVNNEGINLEEMPFIEFNLAEKRFHGNAGVNIMNGEFVLDGNKLTFGIAATTMKAGQEAESTVERAILDNIATVAAVAVVENGLVLNDAEGNALMTLVK